MPIVDEPLLAPDRHVTPPEGVDGVIVNVDRVAQESFYCLGLTRRIRREWDSSSIGYALFGSVAILADYLISGLMLKWNALFHHFWALNRTPKGGEAPCEKPIEPPPPKPASEPHPLFAALFKAYLAHPDKSIEELLYHSSESF